MHHVSKTNSGDFGTLHLQKLQLQRWLVTKKWAFLLVSKTTSGGFLVFYALLGDKGLVFPLELLRCNGSKHFLETYRVPQIATQQFASFIVFIPWHEIFSLSGASLVETPRRGSAGPLMATPWAEEQGGSSFIIITPHHMYFFQAGVLFLRKECKIWAPFLTNFGSFTHFWVYFLQA